MVFVPLVSDLRIITSRASGEFFWVICSDWVRFVCLWSFLIVKRARWSCRVLFYERLSKTKIFIKEMICGVKLHGLSVISLLYDEMGSASCCENQPVIQISEKKHLDLSGFHSQTDPVYILAFWPRLPPRTYISFTTWQRRMQILLFILVFF